VVGHTRRKAGDGPFGPIRPEDASDGWKLAGDASEWWLTKSFGDHRARIVGTTTTTCAWRISAPDGTLIREVSARGVQETKLAADAWAQEHLLPE
jgi:hypothetical protein